MENLFYLETHTRWTYLVKESSSNDIAIKVDKPMGNIENSNLPLKRACLSNFYTNLDVESRTLKILLEKCSLV